MTDVTKGKFAPIYARYSQVRDGLTNPSRSISGAIGANEYAKSDYRPDVDGLRALAVVAVIVNHFSNALLPGGYLGVDIFFVISGFVITASLVHQQSKSCFEF